ncbi:hypothetical protein D3C74_298320 [compost metagenome]
MFAAIWRLIVRLFRDYSNDLGEAIEAGNVRRIIQDVFFGLLAVVGACGMVAALTFGIVSNANFLFTWIVFPLLVLYSTVYWIRTAKPATETIYEIDPVDEELTRQRAREQYDDMLALMFNSIQGAASITPLIRPHDIFDIQSSSPKGDHFYLDKGIVIFQFECELETTIDKLTEDIIQRELQRYVVKQCSRYPMLISSEAQGRALVEVLDIKNLGGHILVECTQTTSASIPLIEARRRARVERQQRQQAVIDKDYPE